MNKKLVILLASLVIGGTVSVTVPLLHAQQNTTTTMATPIVEKVPKLHAALLDLKNARTNLVAVPRPFGGHKAAALKAVDEAIREVNACIKFSEEKH